MIEKTRGGFIVSQIKQIQGRIFDKLLKNNGIDDFNGPQGRILYVLWQQDNLPISELGARTSLAKTSLTTMLDRMEERGYIQRNNAPNDRRQILITLTDKARSLNSKYDEVTALMNQIFYEGFSDETIKTFDNDLQHVLGNLQKWEEQNHGK
ncbi:MAG: radical mobile pair system MarR family transcriptional regulator [Herbinix sp.]|jgi:DNA-binding MarR family transcriptional regulator|nr:radical mobile pair system MarR family transcriptional regulator [Herbinix sp.]